MPRYDFQCGACGEIFEETRTFATATEPAACPVCAERATRLLRVPALVRTGAPEPKDAPDPTKPNVAWRHVAGCACGCDSGPVIRPTPAAASTPR